MTDHLAKLTPYKDGKRRRIMTKELTSVALVGRGANPHANVTFFKSQDKPDGMQKAGDLVDLLTGVTDGHQHGIRIDRRSEDVYVYVDYAHSSGQSEHSHDHSIVRQADGTFVVSENAGHTHDIDGAELQRLVMDRVMKAQTEPNGQPKEDQMADKDLEKQVADLTASLEKSQKEAELARKEAGLTDAEREHYASLDKEMDDDRRAAFLDASHEQRAEIIAKAKEPTELVYTADDGTKYFKSDDPRLVKLARQRDQDVKSIEKQRAEADKERLTKVAETELRHLPGTVEDRVEMLKAVESIEDGAKRDAAMAMLKSRNAANGDGFKVVGVQDGTPDGDEPLDKGAAESKLDEMAKSYAKEHDVGYLEAYEKVLEQNPELYDQTVAG